FFFSSRRRHTRFSRDWSSDVCSSDLSGHREETERLIEKLGPYGLIEFVRSARVAIINDSKGFHEKLKEFESMKPGEDVIENEFRSEERRVGKECRYQWWRGQKHKKRE